MTSTPFIEKINSALDKLKMHYSARSDSELARIIGVAQSTLSGWRTRGALDFRLVIELCANEDLSLDWLFLDIGNPRVTDREHVIYTDYTPSIEDIEFVREHVKLLSDVIQKEWVIKENLKRLLARCEEEREDLMTELKKGGS